MAYTLLKTTVDLEVADIPTMREMSDVEYNDYIRHHLIYLDHHEVLRSRPAGYPLAVTQEQAQALRVYLLELIPEVGER